MSVPKNLEECYVALDEMKIPDRESWLKDDERTAMSWSHHGLGMWIRNNWDLWAVHNTPFWEEGLSDYFNKIGIKHPDDMSSVILTSYYRYKNGKDIELEKQVEEIQSFYKKQNRNKK